MKLTISLFILVFLSVPSVLVGNSSSEFKNLQSGLKYEAEKITKSEMAGIDEFFGGDLFEGRAPGTRGGKLAQEYIRSMLKFLNIKPLGEKYIQPFTITGFTTEQLKIKANGIELKYKKDMVGTYIGTEKTYNFSADTVFIGFGIKTKLWKWDDFKDSDIKGKIVLVRVNDPGMFIKNIFEGKILTYFGRWDKHILEARNRGAVAVLLIHTDASAGYGWNIVKNSWSGEELYLDSDLKNELKFSGWIREESLKKILLKKGIKLNALYKSSLRRNFKPINLGFKINISGRGRSRTVNNGNVIGLIQGKSDKKIVLSAHIDHLGKDVNKKGDNIYNGAIDNGTAVTSLLLSAKILKKFQKKLYYSVVILAPNAEESGLLGTKYFVQNYKGNDIIANINFESTPIWKKSDSIMGIGARFSTFEDMLKKITKKEKVKYSYFSMSNQGFFFRSDQFSFAIEGIPAIWISAGEREISGEENYKKFWKERYHTVKDEFDPSWDFGGLKQTVKFALMLTGYINDKREEPRWKNNLTFSTDRE